ncbi:two-component system sensor histidine kinase ChvG [Rhizomicrobium palustre]|uniref:histidine kinase n=1 Tax=Rhizomicrobium palustre TaxID=189966 RepID=A0A846N0R7_9PROT|nr:HAMP domain-containing sensor histidine kinase [Rhizomicrobium palustre]NIK89075.1 two-component system sensor histidine kinase ChvG [Rhizomicrobium palustre]
MEANSKFRRFFFNLIHSFALKLFVLVIILLTVPLILWWQYQRTERQQAALLHNAVDQTGRVVAAMLRPHFAQFESEPPNALADALAGAPLVNTKVKILVRLKGAAADDFIYIASAPSLPASYLKRERAELIQAGIFQRMGPTCDRATDLSVRFVNPAGNSELLTSMTPVHEGGNCWIVITAQNAADIAPAPLHLSFWEVPALPAAIIIYLLSAALVILLSVHLWRNVRRFRSAARRIRMRGDASFRKLNTIPELTGVAEDFDGLVQALTESQDFIKQTAEENSHALKAPLAVIAQALEPLKRAVPMNDASAQRSLQLIERSVARLDAAVSSVRDLEQAAAEVVYPVRRPIDLTAFLSQMVRDYEITLAAQAKRLDLFLEKGVTAYANEDLLEPVIENILENAASFTPRFGTIEVYLEKRGDVVEVRVADRGPGVDPERLKRIFNRYITYRDDKESGNLPSTEHQGLGLWIVKRNVEGLGGKVVARNREGGGFEISVTLNAEA